MKFKVVKGFEVRDDLTIFDTNIWLKLLIRAFLAEMFTYWHLSRPCELSPCSSQANLLSTIGVISLREQHIVRRDLLGKYALK